MHGVVDLRCATIGPDGKEKHVTVFGKGPADLTHSTFDQDPAPRLELVWGFKERRDGADVYLIEKRSPAWDTADLIDIKEFEFTGVPMVIFQDPSYRISVHRKRR